MIGRYFIVLLVFSVGLCDDKPRVTTPLGEIQGTIRTSADGRKYSAFEGIPFAKPPIGDLRFEEPKPVEPWTGVWIANFTTYCAQTLISPAFSMEVDEDCLHVNVYVPREKPNSAEKLEVIVHVHGGGYMYGSGHWYTNPQFLMDQDIIFVTFNYRVGVLGFLSTEDDVVPGNNGLKDQVLALKWVQENIASFGGNPDSVTLTGLSAGASSVHMHYFSELSKGLFHRGFSQSGVALNSFSLQKEPLKKARILSKAVGCPTSSNKEMVHCLKQRPYQHILSQVSLFFKYKLLPIAPFAPVVEKRSKNPFLSDNPYRLLVQRKVYDVPWIASTTTHEGTVILMFANNTAEEINEKWEDLAPYLLDFDSTLPQTQWKDAAKKVKDFYLGEDGEINMKEDTIKMFSDRIFNVDAEEAARLQSKKIKSPVYYCHFNYPGDGENKLVIHGADALYYFGDTWTNKNLTPNEIKMKDILINMLISYAKTGTPTIQGVDWGPTKYEKLTYLNITSPEDIKLQTTPELTPRAFWKSLGLQENANLISVKDEL